MDRKPRANGDCVKAFPGFLSYPTRYLLVDLLPVTYPEDIYDLPLDFESDAAISHPEFPIPSQALPKGKPVLLGCRRQAGLDRPADAFPHFCIDPGKIDLSHVGVILYRKRHVIPRYPCGRVPGNVSGTSPATLRCGQDRCLPGSRSLP